MITYLDTSALVPLLVDEPSSPSCSDAWRGSDRLTTTRLTFVEASAALVRASRQGRLTGRQRSDRHAYLMELWVAVDVIELDETLMIAAAQSASNHGLRGYDAVHCAAAASLVGPETVAASGDARLLEAWLSEGLAVIDTSA